MPGDITLKEFIDVCNLEVGTWLARISDLALFQDVWRIGPQLIPHLANLIGLEVEQSEETSLGDLRFQVNNAVGWYKIKGSYASLKAISVVLGTYINIFEKYTEDYKTFVLLDYREKDVEKYAPYEFRLTGLEVLLLQAGGRTVDDVLDLAGRHSLVFNGEMVIDTTKLPALKFDGINDYVKIEKSEDFHFGLGAFSIDWYGWFSDRNAEYDICGQYKNSNNFWYIYVLANGTVGFIMKSNGSLVCNYEKQVSIVANRRYHFCISREYAGKLRLFIDGSEVSWTEVETSENKDLPLIDADFALGARGIGTAPYYKGCIDAFRIVKGKVLWSSDFTPPRKYFKAPFLVNEIVLNKAYGVVPNKYLFRSGMMRIFSNTIEKVRPVNVVYEYQTYMNPRCKENSEVMEVLGEIKTKTMSVWEFIRLYLDMTETSAWNLDDGKRLDWRYDAFISAISKWRLGIGNKNKSPGDPGFDLENIVFEGTIDSVKKTGEKVSFEFVVPQNLVQDGLSELGLCFDDNTLQIASTFPDVDKVDGVAFRIVVDVLPKS